MARMLEKEVREGSVVVERDVRIPTRDGGFVAADVYRPAGAGLFPALYAVSPYGKDNVGLPAIPAFRHRETGDIAFYVTHGYAYLHADTRGTGHSTFGDARSVWIFRGREGRGPGWTVSVTAAALPSVAARVSCPWPVRVSGNLRVHGRMADGGVPVPGLAAYMCWSAACCSGGRRAVCKTVGSAYVGSNRTPAT